MSIQSAGDEFLDKLLRHHFGCTGEIRQDSQSDELESRSQSRACHAGRLHEAGEAFRRRLLKYLHSEGVA